MVKTAVKSSICGHCYMRTHLDFCLTPAVVHLEYNTWVLVQRNPFCLQLSFISAENHEHYYHRDKQRCNHNASLNHFDSHGARPQKQTVPAKGNSFSCVEILPMYVAVRPCKSSKDTKDTKKTKKSPKYSNLPKLDCVKPSCQIAKFGHIEKVRLPF